MFELYCSRNACCMKSCGIDAANTADASRFMVSDSAYIAGGAAIPQPQPDQQAFARRVLVIDELGAAVPDLAIGGELHVAGLHAEAELQRGIAEHRRHRVERRRRRI